MPPWVLPLLDRPTVAHVDGRAAAAATNGARSLDGTAFGALRAVLCRHEAHIPQVHQRRQQILGEFLETLSTGGDY